MLSEDNNAFLFKYLFLFDFKKFFFLFLTFHFRETLAKASSYNMSKAQPLTFALFCFPSWLPVCLFAHFRFFYLTSCLPVLPVCLMPVCPVLSSSDYTCLSTCPVGTPINLSSLLSRCNLSEPLSGCIFIHVPVCLLWLSGLLTVPSTCLLSC